MPPALRPLLIAGVAVIAAWALGFSMGLAERGPAKPVRVTQASVFAPAARHIALPPVAANARAEEDDADTDSVASPPAGADEPAPDIIARILGMPGGDRRNEVLQAIIEHLAAHDLPKALAVIEGLSNQRLRRQAIAALLDGWINTDPDAATAYVLALAPGRVRREALSDLLQKLARVDSSRVAQVILGLPARSADDSLGLGICVAWGQKDPVGAATFFLEHGNKFDRDHSVQHVVMHWASRDADAALAWVAALPPSETQAKALENVIRNVANIDPEKAAAFVATLSPEDMENVVNSIASAWAGDDPAKALSWAAQLPGEKARESATDAVVSSWTEDDPDAVATWLNRFPPGPGRDHAVGAFIGTASEDDPEGAAAWALTIGNADTRTHMLRNVWERWRRQDEATAKQWLARTPAIPEQLRKDFLRE